MSFSQPIAADPLPSWNDGPAKAAVLEFVRLTTDRTSPSFVTPAARIATFDQDGTLWVEHPMYTQVVFSFDRILELAPQHPDWKTTAPFQAVLAGERPTITNFSYPDLEKIFIASSTGMDVEAFQTEAAHWLARTRQPRWNRLYTELIYQPMLELMNCLRAHGYTTYIVTGGGQEFVRSFAQRVYGIPPERIIGSAIETEFKYSDDGKAVLMRPPKLLLNDNFSGKPQDIYLFTGSRPNAAFGNSTGDRQMLEYAKAGAGPRLAMLVLHDDAQREYAYGPATGLPESKVGTFTQDLYNQARSSGWTVISMKNDWRRVFAFEK
jgi:phosphoserine phosphatase